MKDLDDLVAGFGRFRHQYFGEQRELFQRLAHDGQKPRIMVIGCCDSRVDPAIITDCNPGDLFVVRNVANLVPPHETGGHYHGTSAALEFAVRCLHVQDVVVLGHSRCGGIRALMTGIQGTDGLGQFIAPWMAIAAEARAALPAIQGEPDTATTRLCEQAAIRISLRNLLSFQWIQERVQSGKLRLHGWYFDMEQGQLLRYNPSTSGYEKLG